MAIAFRSWRGTRVCACCRGRALVVANSAQAQDPTGAAATKTVRASGAPETLGEIVTCTFTVENKGPSLPRSRSLTETSPVPGWDPRRYHLHGRWHGGINEGDTLAPGTCVQGRSSSLSRTIRRSATRSWRQSGYRASLQPVPAAVEGRRVRHGVTGIRRPADISITKTADALSKVGDSVTYTFEICNVGDAHGDRTASTTRCSATSRRPSRPPWPPGRACRPLCGRVRWQPVTPTR